jgi:hypothetical protein
MLLMFAVLGVIASRSAEANLVQAARSELMTQVCSLPGPHTRVLVLARAPADLGSLVIRWSQPCHA